MTLTLAPQSLAQDRFSGLLDALKVVVEVAIFAVLIYVVLRFLRATRGSGIIRGLALVLASFALAFFILADYLELDRLSWLVGQLAPSVVLGLIVVFHPEIRRAIAHLGDAQIFGRFFRRDAKIVPRLLRAVARLSLRSRDRGALMSPRSPLRGGGACRGGVAQLVEQRPFKPVVAGSSPAAPTIPTGP